jgi:hypothetical protein
MCYMENFATKEIATKMSRTQAVAIRIPTLVSGEFAAVVTVPAGAGLGRRRAVPSFRRHSFSACRPPRRVRRLRAPSSSSAGFAFVHRSLDSALSTSHFNPLHVESTFGVSWFADSLQPTELLASFGGPDQAFYSAQPTEAFTSELSAESVALLAVGYIYGGIWAPPPTGLSGGDYFGLIGLSAEGSGVATAVAAPNGPFGGRLPGSSTLMLVIFASCGFCEPISSNSPPFDILS